LGTFIGVGYESTDDLRDEFSKRIREVADDGDGGTLGPDDGMVVGMLLVLGFGCAKSPEEGEARCGGWGRVLWPLQKIECSESHGNPEPRATESVGDEVCEGGGCMEAGEGGG
jgi:hypothetical protein